jgi:hypothetical protein
VAACNLNLMSKKLGTHARFTTSWTVTTCLLVPVIARARRSGAKALVSDVIPYPSTRAST